MTRKIYTASSWRSPHYNEIVQFLREVGHEVWDFRDPPGDVGGFSWSQVDPEWKNWDFDGYMRGLKHPRAKQGFNTDFAGMTWADTCVLILPCGRSAHLEAGWMIGARKPTFILREHHEEPDLMYLLADGIYDNRNDLSIALAQAPGER